MANRSLTASLSLALLVLAATFGRAVAQLPSVSLDFKIDCCSSKDKPVVRQYPVADLVIPARTGPLCASLKNKAEWAACKESAPAESREDNLPKLIKLITTM